MILEPLAWEGSKVSSIVDAYISVVKRDALFGMLASDLHDAVQ